MKIWEKIQKDSDEKKDCIFYLSFEHFFFHNSTDVSLVNSARVLALLEPSQLKQNLDQMDPGMDIKIASLRAENLLIIFF